MESASGADCDVDVEAGNLLPPTFPWYFPWYILIDFPMTIAHIITFRTGFLRPFRSWRAIRPSTLSMVTDLEMTGSI